MPVVCTSLVAGQLGWRDGRELGVADAPADFAARAGELHTDEDTWTKLRAGALARVESDCSPRAFADALREALR